MNKKKSRKLYLTTITGWKGYLESLALVFLVLYPLRHIHLGGDLWDTGYNYSNYLYMGMDHMDPMWLFSTYLSNAFGHFLTMLPAGDTVLGMNLYTGLIVSILAIHAYFICVRRLGIKPMVAFLGEFIAISLCWCPTAKLYDYMTYLVMQFAVMFLFRGLFSGRRRFLVISGILIGLNVFVRFSNLPEASLVLLVWFFQASIFVTESKEQDIPVRHREIMYFLREGFKRSLWWVGGYLGALAGMLVYLGLRYGWTAYFEGISRLMSMTDTARDYSVIGMIVSQIRGYYVGAYWMNRMLFFGLVACAVCTLGKILDWKLGEKEGEIRVFSFLNCGIVITVILMAAMVTFLVTRGFASTYYTSYDSIYNPASVFLLICILVGLIRSCLPGIDRRERLIGFTVGLVLLVTSVGSNNGVYPGFNNLFIAAPYILMVFWKLMKRPELEWKDRKWKEVSLLGLKAAGCVFGVICLIQFAAFGIFFHFSEGTGQKSATTMVDDSTVLEGIRMPRDRAYEYAYLIDYLNLNHLRDRELITYGKVPSLAFYLHMAPSFNPWPDLDSYNAEVLSRELNAIDPETRPLVIMGTPFAEKMETGSDETKLVILNNYLTERGYEQTYRTELFTIYE
jgi:hypothetical protein